MSHQRDCYKLHLQNVKPNCMPFDNLMEKSLFLISFFSLPHHPQIKAAARWSRSLRNETGGVWALKFPGGVASCSLRDGWIGVSTPGHLALVRRGFQGKASGGTSTCGALSGAPGCQFSEPRLISARSALALKRRQERVNMCDVSAHRARL